MGLEPRQPESQSGALPTSYSHHTPDRRYRQEIVGVERFELPTSCSQSKRATRLRYTPIDLNLPVTDAGIILRLDSPSINVTR